MDTLSTVLAATEGDQENKSLCPTLPWKHRLIGFAASFVVGLVFGIFSWISVFLGNYLGFGLMFTLGSISAIAGSFFLAGPLTQAKSMFSEGRWIATLICLGSIILTLMAAIWLKSGILVIILSLIQFGAMWWYFLSYIPGAHTCLTSLVAAKFS